MIIPSYNINDIQYQYDFDNNGIPHSYPNTPPGYSEPQLIYEFHYDGMLKNTQWDKNYNWSVEPPFYIKSGQGTSGITCELLPILSKEREKILEGPRNLSWRDYKYCELNLKINTWSETLNLYYKQGPLWKIEGNKTPKSGTTETYTLLPQYDQTGYPPKYSTDTLSYSFNIKNGNVTQFHGVNPPKGNPKIDIFWHTVGPGYVSFYSAWNDDSLKFPNTLGVLIK